MGVIIEMRCVKYPEAPPFEIERRGLAYSALLLQISDIEQRPTPRYFIRTVFL
jgi:hypothetical protein